MQGRSAPIFFGWKVVGAGFVIALFAWGIVFYGTSVFLHTLHAGRGWPVGLLSAAITTHFLVGAAMVVYLGDVHQRFGVAAVTQAGAVCLAAGALGWAFAAEPWHVFPAAVALAAGWAATSGAAINAMVAPWFEQRRAQALSLAFNGASFGGVLFTPLWAFLIDRVGFPTAAVIIAAATLAVLLPLSAWALRPQPETMGLRPDGRAVDGSAPPQPARPPLPRQVLVRRPAFLTLSAAFAVGLFAQIGLIAHFVALLAPALGDAGAAGAMSLATACAVVGRLLLGAFIGRLDRRLAASGNFLMQACGTVLLLMTSDTVGVLAGCVLIGLGIGNLISLPPLIVQAEFDRADQMRVLALVTAINQAFFSFAPGLFGLLRDLSGSYATTLVLAALLQTAAGGLVLATRSHTNQGGVGDGRLCREGA